LKNLGLTYCTNVHPLGDWAGWQETIGRFGAAVRSELACPTLPMGLWFPESVIREMNRDPGAAQARLVSLLAEQDLTAFTCNAFPYGNFHDRVVKTKVYHPDWTTPERLAYTVSCARLLAALVPAGGEGSVSTLPLGWRAGWTGEHFRAAARNLCAWVKEARALAGKEGRIIRLGLEPEPGCALETIDQVLDFWDRYLRPAASAAGISDRDRDAHCGLCYDTCHQAVQFEDAVASLDRLAAAGIPIVKMQLSSALEFAPDPDRSTLHSRRRFVEERFLHQTRVRTPDGIISFDDLPDALDGGEGGSGARPGTPGLDIWAHPWRVHFHLPIDSSRMLQDAAISTTRGEMLKAYRHALARDLCRHFEVETYTWSVLPEAHRPADDAGLARGIARELRFVLDNTPDPYAARLAGKGGMDPNA